MMPGDAMPAGGPASALWTGDGELGQVGSLTFRAVDASGPVMRAVDRSGPAIRATDRSGADT